MIKHLAYEVARELGKNPEKVYAVCSSFHDGIRYFLLHPKDVDGGLLIHNFLKIELREQKLKRSTDLGFGDVELKQELIEQLEKHGRKKKQTRKKGDDA